MVIFRISNVNGVHKWVLKEFEEDGLIIKENATLTINGENYKFLFYDLDDPSCVILEESCIDGICLIT